MKNRKEEFNKFLEHIKETAEKEEKLWRKPTYDEQVIIQEKVPKLRSFFYSNCLSVFYIGLSLLLCYTMYNTKDEKILIFFIIALFCFLLGVGNLYTNRGIKKYIRNNNYMVLVGQCTKKERKLKRKHYNSRHSSWVYFVNIAIDGEEMLTRTCERKVYNETEIGDELIVIGIKRGENFIKHMIIKRD